MIGISLGRRSSMAINTNEHKELLERGPFIESSLKEHKDIIRAFEDSQPAVMKDVKIFRHFLINTVRNERKQNYLSRYTQCPFF